MFKLWSNQIWFLSKSTFLCLIASFLPYLTLSTFIASSSLLLAISLFLLSTIFFITKKVILPKTPDQNLTICNQIEEKTEPVLLESESELESASDDEDDSVSSSGSFEIFNNNGVQKRNLSDYSVSDDEDEDSLIEIKLPFVVKEEKQDFLQYSIFEQQWILEDNDEDNLIEIDISMGSIKEAASRFDIEAGVSYYVLF